MTVHQYALKDVRCAGCVRSIEKALGRAEGIEEYAINFAERSATVQSELAPDSVIRLIEDAGFGAELLDEADAETRDSQEAEQFRATLTRALVALGVGALLMLLMLTGALPEPGSRTAWSWA